MDAEVIVVRKHKAKKEEDTTIACQWFKTDNKYIPLTSGKTANYLEPGFYKIESNPAEGISAYMTDASNDEIYLLPSADIKRVVSGMEEFWKSKELFRKYNYVHKRGILIHGPAGSGKTSLIKIICQDVIDKGGVVFTISNQNDFFVYLEFVKKYFRVIQPETPMVTVIEDIEEFLIHFEADMLNFLDGGEQIEHNVVIATTNYPEELEDRILDRPSRFDIIMFLDYPNEESRRIYLKNKGLPDDKIEKYVAVTEGFSMAHLKELFISTVILKNDFEEEALRIKDMKKNVDSHDYKRRDLDNEILL